MIPVTWMYGGLAAVGLGLLLPAVPPRPQAGRAPDRRRGGLDLHRRGSSGRSHVGRAEGGARPGAGPGQGRRRRRCCSATAGLEARIATRLEGAGNPLKPAEWLLLHAAIFIGAGVVGPAASARAASCVGLLFLRRRRLRSLDLPRAFKRSRRRKAFNACLPDTLQLMSGSLAAGLSLAQSVDTIVKDGTEPVATSSPRR